MTAEPDPGAVQVVGALIMAGDAILLGLRSPDRRSRANCWDVIGGHIEAGESPVAALTRELREEIGIIAAEPVLFRLVPFIDYVDGSAVLHLFVVDQWDGPPTIANDEHIELCWFNLNNVANLPNLALEEYRDVFADLRERYTAR